jgi:UDP:flavonoid glycosyltransferase YjiC (YdhE family)
MGGRAADFSCARDRHDRRTGAPAGRRTVGRRQARGPSARRTSDRHSVRRLLEDGSFREAVDRVGAEIAALPSPADVADRLHAAYG